MEIWNCFFAWFLLALQKWSCWPISEYLLSWNFPTAVQFKLESHYVTGQRIFVMQFEAQRKFCVFTLHQTDNSGKRGRQTKIISEGNLTKDMKMQREYKVTWCTNLCINVQARGGNWLDTCPFYIDKVYVQGITPLLHSISAVLIWRLQRPSVPNREHQLAQITGWTHQFSLVFIIVSIMQFFVTIRNSSKKLIRDKWSFSFPLC